MLAKVTSCSLKDRSRETSTKCSGSMVPVHQRNHSGFYKITMSKIRTRTKGVRRTVINVVQVEVRVVRVVDDHRTTETIAVLSRQVAVVPESARLAGSREIIKEGVPGRDGALVHERGAVSPVGTGLEQAVPVLKRASSLASVNYAQLV